MAELLQYWGSGYDWRKAEAKLNALPQFMTNIDGLAGWMLVHGGFDNFFVFSIQGYDAPLSS